MHMRNNDAGKDEGKETKLKKRGEEEKERGERRRSDGGNVEREGKRGTRTKRKG